MSNLREIDLGVRTPRVLLASLWFLVPLLLTHGGSRETGAVQEPSVTWSFPGVLEPDGVFRGVVLEEEPEGGGECGDPPCYRPVAPGTEVVMRWQGVVLNEEDSERGYSETVATVEEDGSFESTAPPVVGNRFCECFVRMHEPSGRGKGARPVRVVQSESTLIHAEMIRRPRGSLPTEALEVMRGSQALPRNAIGVFRGTGLDGTRRFRARNLGAGTLMDGPPVGARSYWEVHALPHKLPPGRYGLLLEDSEGELIESPVLDEIVVPRIEFEGTSVLRVGEPGHLYVAVDYQGMRIENGILTITTKDDAIIELEDRRERVPAEGGTVQVPFRALSPGRFEILNRLRIQGDPEPTVTRRETPLDSLVRSEPVILTEDGEAIPTGRPPITVGDPENIPVSDGGNEITPPRDEDVPVPDYVHEGGQTRITPRETVRLTNERGEPIPNTTCEIVTVTEDGAIIQTTQTDENGIVPPPTITREGELTEQEVIEIASTIITHVTQVAEHQWSLPKAPIQIDDNPPVDDNPPAVTQNCSDEIHAWHLIIRNPRHSRGQLAGVYRGDDNTPAWSFSRSYIPVFHLVYYDHGDGETRSLVWPDNDAELPNPFRLSQVTSSRPTQFKDGLDGPSVRTIFGKYRNELSFQMRETLRKEEGVLEYYNGPGEGRIDKDFAAKANPGARCLIENKYGSGPWYEFKYATLTLIPIDEGLPSVSTYFGKIKEHLHKVNKHALTGKLAKLLNAKKAPDLLQYAETLAGNLEEFSKKELRPVVIRLYPVGENDRIPIRGDELEKSSDTHKYMSAEKRIDTPPEDKYESVLWLVGERMMKYTEDIGDPGGLTWDSIFEFPESINVLWEADVRIVIVRKTNGAM